MCRAFEKALRDAGGNPSEVDYINAHGVSYAFKPDPSNQGDQKSAARTCQNEWRSVRPRPITGAFDGRVGRD